MSQEFLKLPKFVTRVDLILGNNIFCVSNKIIIDIITKLEFPTPLLNTKRKENFTCDIPNAVCH